MKFYMQAKPEFKRSERLAMNMRLGLKTTSGGVMDTTELIAEMFLKDYQATWDGEAENWSQITILSDFLVWLDQRKTGGQLIELRLIKNQTAKTVVDELMRVRNYDKKEHRPLCFFYWNLFTRTPWPTPNIGTSLKTRVDPTSGVLRISQG